VKGGTVLFWKKLLLLVLVLISTSKVMAIEVGGDLTTAVSSDSRAARVASDADRPDGESDTVYYMNLKLKAKNLDPYDFSYSLYKNWYQDQGELDIYGHGLKLDRTWKKEKRMARIRAAYDVYVWDGESYFERERIRPEFAWKRGSGKWLTGFAEIERESFRKNSERTGTRTGVGAIVPVVGRKIGRRLDVLGWVADENTNSDTYSHRETGAGLSFSQSLFSVFDMFSANLKWMDREYDEVITRTTKREDKRSEIYVALTRSIDENVSIQVEGLWWDNDSNINDEEYSRAVYSFKVIRTF